MKYADDTNVSEYIVGHTDNNSSLQEVTDSIVDWSRPDIYNYNYNGVRTFGETGTVNAQWQIKRNFKF